VAPIKLKRVEIPEVLASILKQRFKPLVRHALHQGLSGIERAMLWVYLQGVADGAEVEAKTHVLDERDHLPPP
jgi:hypothetical protein